MFGLISSGFGIFSSVRRMVDNALGAVHNRIELAVVELQEERDRAVSILVWSGVLLFMAFMSIFAFAFCLVIAFWQYALWVGLGLGVLFAIGATIAASIVRKRQKTPIFSETINQLRKDRDWLSPEQE